MRCHYLALFLSGLAAGVGAADRRFPQNAITKKTTATPVPAVTSAAVAVPRGGTQKSLSNSDLMRETGRTMVSASIVFGICGVYEVSEGIVAAVAAHSHHQKISGVLGILISKSLHGVMDELVTCYLLGTAGNALLKLGDTVDGAAGASHKDTMLMVGMSSIGTLVKRLRGATTVLLVKKVIQAVLVHMGLKGIGPQALTPLFRHLAGHHHAEIEALERALGAGDMLEKSIDSFIEANPV